MRERKPGRRFFMASLLLSCLVGWGVLPLAAQEPEAVEPTEAVEPEEVVEPVEVAEPAEVVQPQDEAEPQVLEPVVVSLTVDGSDAIYLAGRTDVVIPPLDVEEEDLLLARSGGTHLESLPEMVPVVGMASFTLTATGLINYYNGPVEEGLPPDGSLTDVSEIGCLGGISRYIGPVGALVGVFLDDSIPAEGPAPDPIGYFAEGDSEDPEGNPVFIPSQAYSPSLGQVFFIGDGVDNQVSSQPQTFVVPAGATRLFLGTADAGSFNGPPGFYDDNNGGFQVVITLQRAQ
ncbi:MAG: hypothetical protein JW797_20465 [Bradymonadales bacterium]|nr:hypothetical protein [Bradymonadales bacterium]